MIERSSVNAYSEMYLGSHSSICVKLSLHNRRISEHMFHVRLVDCAWQAVAVSVMSDIGRC